MLADADLAIDSDLLLDAVGLLSELARRPDDPEEARRSVGRLQANHVDTRLQLILDEESYDGSLHYALLVRHRDGLTLSISAAAGTGLPWPLRGVVRTREQDLLAVNGVRVPVVEALACIDGMFDDQHLLRTLVDTCLIAQALDDHPVEVSPSRLQETADAFRRAKKLYSAEATRAWLSERSLSEERFAQLVEHQAMARALRLRVVGDRVRDWYGDHRAELGMVSAAWVALPADGGDAFPAVAAQLEADPLSAILTAHRHGRGGGLAEWRIGELVDGRRALPEAETGSAVPVDIGGPAAAVVLNRRAAVLDGATRDFVERQLFDEWLSERRRSAQVQWFWGNDARTTRAVER